MNDGLSSENLDGLAAALPDERGKGKAVQAIAAADHAALHRPRCRSVA
ncbi:hypothetical protein [uncultured Bosea sp.]|nr:hypothetical protein [uncultured Bosea sp.]